MSQADTEAELTDESTFIAQADPSSESTSIPMESTESSKDYPSSSQEQLKEVSQSSSSDTSLLNIVAKDPEKELKDESNKTTDSPKRVKLLRPAFDKEKLAQKIREIEERDKLKQLNKLKEQELAKSEEKSGDDSSENKTQLQDTGKSENSEHFHCKNVESDKEVENGEKSTSKTLDTDKLSKVDVKLKEDSVPEQDRSQEHASSVDSEREVDEKSVEDSSVNSKKDVNIDKCIKSDLKPTPSTSAHVPEKQKQGGGSIFDKDDVKSNELLGKGKIIESDAEVSSTVDECAMKKETKVEELTKKEGLEQKVVIEKQVIDIKKVGSSEAEANVEETTNKCQIQAGGSSTEIATTSKNVISGTNRKVGSIENKDIEDNETSDVCKRVENKRGEKVVSKDIIDSDKLIDGGSKVLESEKVKEDSIVTGSVKERESDAFTTGKFEKTITKDEIIVKELVESDAKKVGKSSVLKKVSDLDGKSKDEKSGAEVIESKVPENIDCKIEKTLSSVMEEEKSPDNKEKQVVIAEKMESIKSASRVNVHQSIESVLDELTVEPSKAIEKSLGKVGLGTTSKIQESAASELKHVDECSNKSDDILLEIEKFIDSSGESPQKVDKSNKIAMKTEGKLEDNQKIVVERLKSESKIVSSGENSAPTSSKRKLDDEIFDEDIKKKYSSNIIESKESSDNDNLGTNDIKDDAGQEKFGLELVKETSLEESMEISDSKSADQENKEETNDKSSSKDSKDDDDEDEKTKEAPPLEIILDSIIDTEHEPAEIPEEDLVISDIPSTALVDSKIPESPRRVKLVRPSKPVTKTLTKPEATQKISQIKPVEEKVVSESKVEKDISVEASTGKSYNIQEKATKKSDEEDTKKPAVKDTKTADKRDTQKSDGEDTKKPDVNDTKKADKGDTKELDVRDTKKADKGDTKEPEKEVTNKLDEELSKKPYKEETKTTSVPQTSDKPAELEKSANVPNEPSTDEKVDSSEEIESSIAINPPTEKAVASKLLTVEKLPTEKPIAPSIAPTVVETSSVEPELKLDNKSVVESQETRKSVEETLPNQPQEKVISTKELSKDETSGKLPLEAPVSQPEEKVIEKILEPSVDLTSSVEKSSLLKSTEPLPTSSIVKENVVQPTEKSSVEKSISEKPVATSKRAASEEVSKEPLVTKESTEKLTEVSKIHEVGQSKVTSSKDVSKEPVVAKEQAEKLTEVSKVLEMTTPEKIEAEKRTPEKSSPITPGESETAKLRRIIRKPKVERSSINQAETVTSTTVLHDVEKKQDTPSTSKQCKTDMKKAAQESSVLDMTVEEEDSSSIVTSSETKQEAETKQLGFKLKIAKSSTTIIPKEEKIAPQSSASILAEKLMSQKSTEHTFGSITISATTSKHQTDMKKVEEMLKDTDVTITPLVDRESVQKLSKITLKIGKDGNPPEIKQTGSSDIIKRKQGEDDAGSPSRKKMKDESAVLTTSSGVEIDLHMKKSKLLSSLIAEPPMTSQDPRMMMAQQMMAQTSQQMMGLTAQQQAMVQQMISQQMMSGQQMMMSQTPQQMMTPQQTKMFLGTPQSFPGSPGTPGSGVVVKKKRGRPRKIPLPEGHLPQDQQLQALKQQLMMQSQQGSSGTGTTSSGSGGSDEYSSGVFPQVPLFDMTESLFDQPHLFPNQVNPMQEGRPQRSCRGRIKLPSVRSRKPRGSTMAARAAAGTGRGRGRGRGRGYKRVEEFKESDNIITLENVKEEMRRQSMEQAQFLASSSEPMEVTLPKQEPATDAPSSAIPATDPAAAAAAAIQGAMKSPERKPRKRRNEEAERLRIEKIKQRKEEKKMKTLEKKRKIAEAKAKEKAAVMAAALVEEETRMSAPERKEEAEKKKDVIKTEEEEEEKKVEGCDESIKVEPSSFQDINKESSPTNTADTVEPSFVTPRKEKKIYRCLICREESALKKLTSPLDHRSWRVLYQAAIVRGHEEIINLTKNLSDEIPTGILYHRNCRSEFTHKKTLAKLTDCPLPEDQPHHHHHQPAAVKTAGAENINPNTPKEVRMEGTITEYQWPLQGGELYMIQEQVSDFLEITSFKRKYPDIFRRTVEPEEKAYLRENGLVSEAHCDLGLIAVKSSDVLDIMFADFQDKYEEFRKQIRDKQARELSSKHKAAFTSLLMDKRKFENRVLDAKTEAMQAMAAWNSRLNRTRVEQRRCMLDLQSMIVHYPKTVGIKRSQVPNPPGKVGHYPVALVPGQFSDHYKRYNTNELKYFPLNTVIYGPMKPNERFGGGSDGSQSDSDSSSSSNDSSDSSSDSSQDSDASGDESNDNKDAAKERQQQASGETHCKMCGGDKTRNKQDNPEVLINCAQCTKSSQLLQLNRVPTVLLIKSPLKPQSSLSKLLKPASSPSPVKKLKTETGSIGTDSPPKPPSVLRFLRKTESGFIGTANPTDSPKPSVARVLGGKTETGSTSLDSPKPSIVRVLGTQVVKVQGRTQFVGTQEAQSIRVLGTQIVKPQQVPGMKVQGTQEAQSIRVMGTQIVKPQEVPSINVVRTQIVKTQEPMGSQIVKTQEVPVVEVQGTLNVVNSQATQSVSVQQPKVVETEDTLAVQSIQMDVDEPQNVVTQNVQSIKPQESYNVGSQEAQRVEVQESKNGGAQPTQSNEVPESQNFDTQRVQGQEIRDVEIVETQSIEVEEAQNVEVLEAQSVKAQDNQNLEAQGTQNIAAQEISSAKTPESRNEEVTEAQNIKVQQSQRVEIQESQSIKVQQPQAVENQDTQGIEVQGSQNVDSQEAQYTKPSPEHVISSDRNTSNSTDSTLQSNTVSSDSTVDSSDKADTVSSTVETV